MKPGRELDALIAEKVMGCNVRKVPGDSPSGPREIGTFGAWMYENMYHCDCSKSADSYPTHGRYNGVFFSGLKQYSTDIAAAWEVVEKLEDENDVRIWGPHRRLREELEDTWECEFTNKTRRSWYSSNAETAAHAICLAALKAVGVDI